MFDKIHNATVDFTMDDLPCESFRDVYAYWLANKPDDGLPPVDAISPLKLPRQHLPYIGVMTVERDPMRFHIRVSGTGVTDATGIEFTGKYVDEIPGTEAALERFAWCADNGLAYFVEGPITWSPNDFMDYRVIGLPFAGPGGTVDRVMLVFDFS